MPLVLTLRFHAVSLRMQNARCDVSYFDYFTPCRELTYSARVQLPRFMRGAMRHCLAIAVDDYSRHGRH